MIPQTPSPRLPVTNPDQIKDGRGPFSGSRGSFSIQRARKTRGATALIWSASVALSTQPSWTKSPFSRPGVCTNHARVYEGVAKSQFPPQGSCFQKWIPCPDTLLNEFTPSKTLAWKVCLVHRNSSNARHMPLGGLPKFWDPQILAVT